MNADPICRKETNEPDAGLGRTVNEQARRIGRHPSAIIRYIRLGHKLSSGGREYLAATFTPGGYRVTDNALAAFFDAITRDRLGRSAEAPPIVCTPKARSKRLDRVDRELAALGI